MPTYASSAGQANLPMDSNPWLRSTSLPPIPYPGASPYEQPIQRPKIYASQMEQLPDLVSRMDILERNSEDILRANARRALSNSMLPGLDPQEYAYPAQRPPSRSGSQQYPGSYGDQRGSRQ